MPYIYEGADPWNPYVYVTKQGRPRLPPNYFTKGYAFYQQHMNAWMNDLQRENDEYWKMQSKYNKRKLYKPVTSLGEHRIPIYYNYTDYLKKARKYALIKRKIYLNKKRALAKYKARYK